MVQVSESESENYKKKTVVFCSKVTRGKSVTSPHFNIIFQFTTYKSSPTCSLYEPINE